MKKVFDGIVAVLVIGAVIAFNVLICALPIVIAVLILSKIF